MLHLTGLPRLMATGGLLLALGCNRSKPAAEAVDAAVPVDSVQATDSGAPGCPPAPVAVGSTRARAIACEADAPVGAMAAARVGDIVLENAKARFVIRAGPHGHAIVGLTGGNVIDAVLVGADGKQRGVDGLREWVPTVGFHLVRPDEVTIVAAGGSEARVRVTGPLVPFPLIYELLAPDLPLATVVHEYVLRPDETALEIRTTVTPQNGQPLDGIIGDVTFWGGDLALYLPGSGEGALPSGVQPTLIAYVPVHAEELTVPVAAAFEGPISILNTSGIQAFLQTPGPVPAAGRTIVRRLAVGGNGRQDLAAAMAAARGPGSALGTVQGTVAGMWPGVEVEILDGQGGPLTRCRPGATGAFECQVPVTAVAARAQWLGNGNGELGGAGQLAAVQATPIAIQAGQSVTADLTAPQPGRLDVEALDGAGQPVPFKLVAYPVDPANAGSRTWFDTDGKATFLLPAGTWDLWLHHGPEWSEHHAKMTLQAGQVTKLAAKLEHVVETDGWLACDMHVHAEHSSDSTVPNSLRLRNAVAEALDYVVATDHDFVTDYKPWLIAAGLQDQLTVASGVEVSTLHLGHFNAWPLVADPKLAGNGAVAWFGKKPEALLADMHGGDPLRVVQSNHPRGSQSYFDGIELDTKTTDVKLLDFDAVELINAKRMSDIPEVLADWFGLQARGIRITGTGNSDTHTLSAGIGGARTWIYVGKDAAGAWLDKQGKFTAAQADAALKAGRAVATTGPLLVLEIEGAGGAKAAIGDTLKATTGTLTVRATVQAPAWMPLGSIELYRNGKLVHTEAAATTPIVAGRRLAVVTQTSEAGQDAWWVAIHKPGASPAAPSQNQPLWAITNPVFVDGDGDGKVAP